MVNKNIIDWLKKYENYFYNKKKNNNKNTFLKIKFIIKLQTNQKDLRIFSL